MMVSAAAAAALAVLAAPAAAAETSTCRASAARAEVPSLKIDVEPVRANAPGTPCTSQSASTVAQTTIGPVTADAVGAFTSRTATVASALASVSNPKVDLGGLVVEAQAVDASATATCTNGASKLTGASRVVGLTINGQSVQVPPGDAPVDIPLGPLGTVSLNQQTTDAARGTITRRAIAITTPLADVTLAEAVAGGACESVGTEAGGGVAPGGGTTAARPCPQGADYDPSRNLCVIHDSTGATIVVGRPYQGPSGGSVISLTDARKRYRSACLSGKGSRYVIVGTRRNDRITGTNHSDRILLLAGNDQSEGGRGNDCIDGAAGNDTESGALGRDRLIGGRGRDHLVGGSQSDTLNSGPGNDTINTGFGRDRVNAGRGADKVNAATAGPASKRLVCGQGRDKIRVNRNERRKARARTAHCERVYVIR